MARTVELDGDKARYQDSTSGGERPTILLRRSIAVTEGLWHDQQVPTATVDQALPFGGVATAKLLIVKSDYSITVKVNGEATGHAGKLLLLHDDAAGITSATISNASGSTATVETLVGG